MNKHVERRTLPLDTVELELRQEEGENATLQGKPIVFNSLSVDLGGFLEKIDPNAFDDQLSRKHDIVLLANHDTASVLARESNGTLTLEKRDTGIRMTAKPNMDTSDGKDAVARVRRRDVIGMSFGFVPLDDRFDRDDKGNVIRTITTAELIEVSIVTFPAYEATSVSARALEKAAELNEPEPEAPQGTPHLDELEARMRDIRITRVNKT